MKKRKVPPVRTLQLRKRRDGRVTVEGQLPDVHAFSARWIDRWLGDLVDVTITLRTTDGPVAYQLTGYDPLLDTDGNPLLEESLGGDPVPKKNWTALVAKRIKES